MTPSWPVSSGQVDDGRFRHRDGWVVERLDRGTLLYSDHGRRVRVEVEDVPGGVVVYAPSVAGPEQSGPDADLVARCALGSCALGAESVEVDWGVPRWGATGQDEAYCLLHPCVVRLRPGRGTAEYEDAAGVVVVPLRRVELAPDVATASGHAETWVLSRTGLPLPVADRVVEALRVLTGEPVRVDP